MFVRLLIMIIEIGDENEIQTGSVCGFTNRGDILIYQLRGRSRRKDQKEIRQWGMEPVALE